MYLNEWQGKEGMISDFCGHSQGEDGHAKLVAELEGAEILLASYGTGSYEGDAFVLFRKDGQLFEVNAGHCSCYGLEGQWQPEATTKAALLHRMENGSLGSDDGYCGHSFGVELAAILAGLED